MYVNYGYYESKYLLGREPTVPEDDFLFWEKQTERILNQYTFGRLNADSLMEKRRRLESHPWKRWLLGCRGSCETSWSSQNPYEMGNIPAT